MRELEKLGASGALTEAEQDLRSAARRILAAVQEFLKTQPDLAAVDQQFKSSMKKILIIEDDQIVANVYRNKLAVEGYQAEVAPDGETGLKIMRTFQPELIILDLMLPAISGVDVIKEVRSEPEFAKTPIIVFSNTYLTNLIQDAWRAGANKCLSKSSCSPKDVIDVVRNTIGDSGAMPQANPSSRRYRQPGKPASAGRRKTTPNFRRTCARPSSKACPPRSIRCAPGCRGSSRRTTK